jgi:hypothetical protein
LNATASGDAEIEAYEMDLRRDGRCLVLNVRKLAYDADHGLLVGILNVTEARANAKQQEDLVREKTVLLQELQHRAANSMQIIASVILQTARRSKSDEAPHFPARRPQPGDVRRRRAAAACNSLRRARIASLVRMNIGHA